MDRRTGDDRPRAARDRRLRRDRGCWRRRRADRRGRLGSGHHPRAVAARAGSPHGAVSYHFNGKQDLLIEAALHAFEQAVPFAEFEAMKTSPDLIDLIAAEIGDRDAIDPRALAADAGGDARGRT